jgi:hypothetical protein
MFQKAARGQSSNALALLARVSQGISRVNKKVANDDLLRAKDFERIYGHIFTKIRGNRASVFG